MHRYSTFVAAFTFILIVAGGLVTSTGSGLAVPDWPLSYGQFFPPMVGGIRFEHSHRVIAGAVGILTFILSVLLWVKDRRAWVRRLGVGAFLLVVIQALLGGVTVVYLLPTMVSVLHACLAQTFFCLVAALALVTSHEWRRSPVTVSSDAPSLKRLLMTTTAFVYLQLVAGSFVRHASGKGLPAHFVIAFLIVLHVLIVVFRVSGSPELGGRLFRHTITLGILVITQLFLGLGSFIFIHKLPALEVPGLGRVLMTTTHQAMGALILVACFLLTLRAFRLFR